MLVDEGGALRTSLALDHEAGLTHQYELGSMIIDPVDSTILAVPDVSEKGYLDVAKFPSSPVDMQAFLTY